MCLRPWPAARPRALPAGHRRRQPQARPGSAGCYTAGIPIMSGALGKYSSAVWRPIGEVSERDSSWVQDCWTL